MLLPMCREVVEGFEMANQPVPKILYVGRGCCCAHGSTAVETLLRPWVDRGMNVQLDIFHWIQLFDAAVRSDSHSEKFYILVGAGWSSDGLQ